jgi:hypothetical protein
MIQYSQILYASDAKPIVLGWKDFSTHVGTNALNWIISAIASIVNQEFYLLSTSNIAITLKTLNIEDQAKLQNAKINAYSYSPLDVDANQIMLLIFKLFGGQS